MKNKCHLFTCFFLISLLSVTAQNSTSKEQKLEENKVQIFTFEERDNLQIWFYEKVNEMGLTETKREEYYSVILYYSVKMNRLDDKDMGYTKAEVEQKLEELLKKQDIEIKKLLPKDAYKTHLENYGELMRSVRNRMAQPMNQSKN